MDQHHTTHHIAKHVPEFKTLMDHHQTTHHITKHVPEFNTLMDQYQTIHHTTKHGPEFNTLMDHYQITQHTTKHVPEFNTPMGHYQNKHHTAKPIVRFNTLSRKQRLQEIVALPAIVAITARVVLQKLRARDRTSALGKEMALAVSWPGVRVSSTTQVRHQRHLMLKPVTRHHGPAVLLP
jgi:hypothetical protein